VPPSSSNQSSPWRALAFLFVLLAVMGGTMGLQRVARPELALDLAGGTTVTLKAVTERGRPPSPSSMDQALEIMRNRVNGFGISEAEVSKQGDDIIIVEVPGEGQRKVVELIGTTAKLDMRQVLVTEPAGAPPRTPPAPSPGATAEPGGEDGGEGGEKATPAPSASPTGTPAKGRAVPEALAQPSPAPTGEKGGGPAPSPNPSGSLSPEQLEQLQRQLAQQQGQQQQPQGPDFSGIDKAVVEEYKKLDCTKQAERQARIYPGDKPIAVCDRPDPATGTPGANKYILGPVKVSGNQLTGASAVPPNPQQGTTEWTVSLNFNGAGARAFSAFTAEAAKIPKEDPKNRFGIVLDGQVVSAPGVNEPIPGGSAEINGMSGQVEANELANVLKYGSLPLVFEQQSVDQISSSLGSDQLRGGLLSGAIGLALVVLFSMFYYRGLGIVSVLSLVVAAAVTYEAVVILSENAGFRLSLAHVIGLVVSIGITADSFIVYFERLRDELRSGKTLRSGVESAWQRARRTILVADAVTIIAAVVLYFLAVGGVAGFAFAMGLTTLIDIAVVFLFTKPLVALLARTDFFAKGHRLSGLDPDRLRRSAPTARRRPQSQEA
jgi:preprotein translocase subunit SecD